jgi:hypothetical protein
VLALWLAGSYIEWVSVQLYLLAPCPGGYISHEFPEKYMIERPYMAETSQEKKT